MLFYTSLYDPIKVRPSYKKSLAYNTKTNTAILHAIISLGTHFCAILIDKKKVKGIEYLPIYNGT